MIVLIVWDFHTITNYLYLQHDYEKLGKLSVEILKILVFDHLFDCDCLNMFDESLEVEIVHLCTLQFSTSS